MIHVFFFIYFISSFLTCTYMHKCIRMPTHTLHMDVHMQFHRNMQAYTFCVLDLLVIIHAHLYNTRSSHKCHSQSANQIPLKLYQARTYNIRNKFQLSWGISKLPSVFLHLTTNLKNVHTQSYHKTLLWVHPVANSNSSQRGHSLHYSWY